MSNKIADVVHRDNSEMALKDLKKERKFHCSLGICLYM